MNDTILMVGFGVFAAIVCCAVLFSIVHGVRGSLTDAKVGQVYNFEYEQPHHGEPERVLARVIEPVHTLDDFQIRRLNASSAYRRHDPKFVRTKHIVTCEMPNGEIRNFYAERTKNVRRCLISNNTFRNAVAAML